MKSFEQLVKVDPSDYNGERAYCYASNHWLRVAAFSRDWSMDNRLFEEVLYRGGIDIDTARVCFGLYGDLSCFDPFDIFYVAAHNIDDDDNFWLRDGLTEDDIDDMYPPFSDEEEDFAYHHEKELFDDED